MPHALGVRMVRSVTALRRCGKIGAHVAMVRGFAQKFRSDFVSVIHGYAILDRGEARGCQAGNEDGHRDLGW
jgi:hypothetical protein